MPDSPNEWLKTGAPHIWHPYTQMLNAPVPLSVIGAHGCHIQLDDGRELLDGISSWWTMCHGYNHPHIIEAVAKQLSTLPHVMFAGLAHEPAYTLAARLCNIAPSGLNHVFYSDSGSVAVEVALKMAVQFWRNQGDKNKTKFISFRNGYHGDTMGAMSLSDPDHSMHQPFNSYMPKQFIWDIPLDEFSFTEFDELLAEITKTTAALVIEPLVQCAGGMVFHSPDVLAEIYRLCKKHHILFIADEIATGFGRTGSLFACDEAGITPDIMCIGKALTGGVLPLAATLATDEIYSAFLSGQNEKALMHGPTFMANPLACAAANASLDLFQQQNLLHRVETIEEHLWAGLAPCRTMSQVRDVRVKGAIGVVQLAQSSSEITEHLRKRFIEEGVWLRPFGDIIYVMPPFCITESELDKMLCTLVAITQELCRN
jgi:adenosylmethionine-8-amino-7-oxononanoate aminotransferase